MSRPVAALYLVATLPGELHRESWQPCEDEAAVCRWLRIQAPAFPPTMTWRVVPGEVVAID